jgi:hypothetical protein
VDNSVVVDPWLQLVWFAAPQIEAAGSIDRAIECELLGGFGEDGGMLLVALRSMVPVSRGGTHPGDEATWLEMVSEAVADRQVDMEALRRVCELRGL